jgi:heme/copper-type cytochrome/quinol oxidase subunit 4
MDASLKLFIIGFAVSIIVTIILDQNEDDEEGFMKSFVTKGAKLWQLVFMLTVLTTIPFIVIEPLKKRFTRKTFLPFPFLGGYGTGFLLMGSIGMIFSLVA